MSELGHKHTFAAATMTSAKCQQATFWPDQGPRKKLRHISVCAVPFVDKGYSDRVSLLRSDAAAVTAGNGDEQRVGGGVTAKLF